MSAASTTRTIGALVLWTSLVAPGWAQDVRLLDCAQVQFFGPACVPVTPLPPAPPPPTPSPAPLFSPETMAPDTPPLLPQAAGGSHVSSTRRPFLTGSTGVRSGCRRCSSCYAG